jgi:TatD family-associated radical SAM protein
MDHVGESHSLWLEREPTAQEVEDEFLKWDFSQFTEIVFCGFGEPTCALPVLLEVATWLKTRTDLPIRLNTNGQGSLIAGRDISKELKQCFDVVSISLNDPDPVRYQELVRSQFGEAAFPGMLEFAKNCAAAGLKVIMTTVATTITHEEEARCQEICDEIGATYRIRPWED